MSAGAVLFVVGATHHRAPLDLREKLALPPAELAQFRTDVSTLPGMREMAVLNTCNRIEFYGVAEAEEAIAALQSLFCQRQGIAEEGFAGIRLHETGRGAVHHLIEVAAGLDSQMVGENEIFGQVKEAYADARGGGTAGPVLNRLFQKCFQAAKHVRTHTAITAGNVSTANVAVDLALTIFGELDHARVLLLGAGDIGEKTARAFRSRGAGELTVSSRTLPRAMELASELDAAALPFEHVERHLVQFDIIVCAMTAPQRIVTAPAIAAAMRQRPAQPLFLIDLALPRNVEPLAAARDNVFLYNLDDLARIAERNRAAREAEVHRARLIVQEKAAALWRQLSPHAGGNSLVNH